MRSGQIYLMEQPGYQRAWGALPWGRGVQYRCMALPLAGKANLPFQALPFQSVSGDNSTPHCGAAVRIHYLKRFAQFLMPSRWRTSQGPGGQELGKGEGSAGILQALAS